LDEELKTLFIYDVDGIFTDFLDIVVKVLQHGRAQAAGEGVIEGKKSEVEPITST